MISTGAFSRVQSALPRLKLENKRSLTRFINHCSVLSTN